MPFCRVSMPALDEPLNEQDHLRDVLSRARLDGGRQSAKSRRIGVELCGGALGQLANRDAFLGGARVDLVVHIRDVAHVNDMVRPIKMAQKPEKNVEHDHRPRIADMGEIVHRRSAHIQAYRLCIERFENVLASCPRIIKL